MRNASFNLLLMMLYQLSKASTGNVYENLIREMVIQLLTVCQTEVINILLKILTEQIVVFYNQIKISPIAVLRSMVTITCAALVSTMP